MLDVGALTALLGLAGAAQNPFTMLYFVPIALSTMISQGWTWTVASGSVLGFAVLLWRTASTAGPHAQHGHFFHHVAGMAIALAVAGALVTYFVHRIARDLAEQRAEVVRLHREREQDRLVTSLGALAAGAAHELGTPLGTVHLLAGELEFLDEKERREAAARIETEVTRMKGILHGMTSSKLSAQLLAEQRAWRVQELAGELGAALHQVAVTARGEASTTQPRPVLSQILRELVRNAERASSGFAGIRVELTASPESLRCLVADSGVGMDAAQLDSALSPFVSHGGGRGLGLFLASVHVRQLGGRLELESKLGSGTKVWFELPLEPPGAEGIVT